MTCGLPIELALPLTFEAQLMRLFGGTRCAIQCQIRYVCIVCHRFGETERLDQRIS
jgi:hypothetical protein